MSRRKLLAVSSGGGHWVQLRRVIPAFEGLPVVFVTVDPAYREEIGEAPFHVVRDATRWNKFGLLVTALQIAWIVVRERPGIVFSTGAAPGLLAILFGRLFGARTIWLDSMANIDEVSLSGQRIGPHTDLWLTQWEHLAEDGGPEYAGQVF